MCDRQVVPVKSGQSCLGDRGSCPEKRPPLSSQLTALTERLSSESLLGNPNFEAHPLL